MDADCVNHLDFPASALKSIDVVIQRSRSVSAWEDILVHEETPNQILVLPALSQTSNLEVEDSIIIHHIIALLEEASKMSDTNVLSHLETCDFVVFALWNWDIAVIHAKNFGLFLSNSSPSETIVTPGSLVTAQSDTSSLSTVVDTGKFGKGSPSTTNIEKPLAWLEVNLLTDNSEFVVLQLFKGLLLVWIRDNTGSIDHTWAEEPSVEVITSVVMVADLLLICGVLVREALN